MSSLASIKFQQGVIATIAVGLALYLGFLVAEGQMFMPIMVTLGLVGVLVIHAYGKIMEACVVSFLLIGYFVGSRGFAQLSPIPRSPLFFGELALALTIPLLFLRSVTLRDIPFRLAPASLFLLGFIIYCSLRFVLFDFREHRITGIRDFATVYYAFFFFVAAPIAIHPVSLRIVRYGLLVGSCLLLLITPVILYDSALLPRHTLVAGMPVIFHKMDLTATFLVCSFFIFFGQYIRSNIPYWLLPAFLALGSTVLMLSRASWIAFVVAAVFATIAWKGRFLRPMFIAGFLGLTVLFLHYGFVGHKDPDSFSYAIAEHAISIADPKGERSYTGGSSHDSGANNRFRLSWWKTLINQTLSTNPVFGLGFGTDIAGPFVREYWGTNDTFDARSPHSIILTIFARTGFLGLALFLSGGFILALEAYRRCAGVTDPKAETDSVLYWLLAITVFTSACFGVVLEGPMGAIPFWVFLGIAYHLKNNELEEEAKT